MYAAHEPYVLREFPSYETKHALRALSSSYPHFRGCEMRRNLISLVYAMIFPLLFVSGLSAEQQAQTDNSTQPSTPEVKGCQNLKDPAKLNNDVLIQCKDDLQKSITDLNTKLTYLRDIRGYLADLAREKQQSKREDLEKKIADTEPWAGLHQGDGQKPAEVDKTIRQVERDLSDETKDLRAMDTEISQRLNIQGKAQDFKSRVSLYFSFLVALVIACFFLIANSDPKVKQEIFSERQGLQFITLFVLIIAIILFGVTGVLEGKELAALLGGLAGYILGSSASGRDKSRDGGTNVQGQQQQQNP
jgi:hypothetical protein